MPSEKDIQQQVQLLGTYRSNIAFLLGQKAQYGDSDIPLRIANELTKSRSEIRRIKAILRDWNYPVEGHPNDLDAWEWDQFDVQASDAIRWESSKQRYLEEMKRIHGSMRILGMSTPVSLDGIFTSTSILDKPSAWRNSNINDLEKQFGSNNINYSPLEAEQKTLDAVIRHKRLYILGKPGAGKTTFLKYLTLQAIDGRIDFIPILVTMRDWLDKRLELMKFLAYQFDLYSFPQADQFIEYILKEGKALVLFDGLDEISQEQQARDSAIRAIREFSDRYGKSHFIITCRIATVDYQFEHFTYWELPDFNELQMELFVKKWFQNNAIKRDAFLKKFAERKHDRLRDLSRTPLLLTLLCINFDETMSFPTRRAEIYEEALDTLLKKWDISRNIQRDTVYKQLSLGYKRQLLTNIAIETFPKNEIFMRQVDLEGRIQNYLSKLPTNDSIAPIASEVILKAIEAQHGLLVERAQNIYSFSHLTFHEYFTARYIAEHPSERLFREYTAHNTDSRWREVLLLTASLLDADNAKTFFECFTQTLDRIISSEPKLRAILVWTTQTAAAVGAADFATRLSYLRTALTVMLIPQIARIRGLAAVLAPALARARDLATTLAQSFEGERASIRGMANDLEQDLVRASNWASSIATDLDRASDQANMSALALTNARASTSANNLATDLANASSLATDLANTSIAASASDRASELALGLASASDGFRNLARQTAHASGLTHARDHARAATNVHRNKIAPLTYFNNDLRVLVALAQTQIAVTSGHGKLFTKEIRGIWQHVMANQLITQPEQKQLYADLQMLVLPATSASKQTWRQFSDQLQQILVNHGYTGPSAQLDGAQYLLLDKYFQALALLLECLDLATIADREGIRNRLLLPPAEA